MHAYASNASDRQSIPKRIAIVAIVATLAFNGCVQFLKWPIPWYLDTPAVASFYGFFILLFDHRLWSYKLGIVSFSQIPDIRGTWVGKLHSSFNGTERQVVVYIKQTWLSLLINLETDTAASFTTMAAFNIDAGNDSGIKYEYRNEGKAYGPTPDHRGTGHLFLSPDNKKLEGKYYTSEGSNNTGTICLYFIAKNHLTREEALDNAKTKRYI